MTVSQPSSSVGWSSRERGRAARPSHDHLTPQRCRSVMVLDACRGPFPSAHGVLHAADGACGGALPREGAGVVRPIAFMVMPFTVKATGLTGKGVPAEVASDALWERVCEPMLEHLGYSAVRADRDVGALIITEKVQRLAIADLVVADLCLPNANVYYELGVRHAARRTGCVFVPADWTKPLFDVAQMRQVRFPLPDGGGARRRRIGHGRRSRARSPLSAPAHLRSSTQSRAIPTRSSSTASPRRADDQHPRAGRQRRPCAGPDRQPGASR